MATKLTCQGCKKELDNTNFSNSQIKKGPSQRKCRTCVQHCDETVVGKDNNVVPPPAFQTATQVTLTVPMVPLSMYNELLRERQELLKERDELVKKVLDLGLPVETKRQLDEQAKTIKQLQEENNDLKKENKDLHKKVLAQKAEIDKLNESVNRLVKMESKLAIRELIAKAKRMDSSNFTREENALLVDIKIKKETNKTAHYYPPEKIKEAINHVYTDKQQVFLSIFQKVFPLEDDDEESDLDGLFA